MQPPRQGGRPPVPVQRPVPRATCELFQRYLDENKRLIVDILDSQNRGNIRKIAQYQASIQYNLVSLAAIADTPAQGPLGHSQVSSMPSTPFSVSSTMGDALAQGPLGHPQQVPPTVILQGRPSMQQPMVGSFEASTSAPRVPMKFTSQQPQQHRHPSDMTTWCLACLRYHSVCLAADARAQGPLGHPKVPPTVILQGRRPMQQLMVGSFEASASAPRVPMQFTSQQLQQQQLLHHRHPSDMITWCQACLQYHERPSVINNGPRMGGNALQAESVGSGDESGSSTEQETDYETEEEEHDSGDESGGSGRDCVTELTVEELFYSVDSGQCSN